MKKIQVILFGLIVALATSCDTQIKQNASPSKARGSSSRAGSEGEAPADCEVATTTTGSTFCQIAISGSPEVRWEAPDRRIWGEILKNADGSPRLMNQADAKIACTELGATLPGGRDFQSLISYMGAELAPDEDGFQDGAPSLRPFGLQIYRIVGYTPQILTDLAIVQWTADYNIPGSAATSRVFNGQTGSFWQDSDTELHSVRCLFPPRVAAEDL